MIYLRLLRPIIHFIIILATFFFVYKLRIYTDLIPFVHLRIPRINFWETMLFGILSAIIFVFIWMFRHLYKLKWPIHRYYHKFIKVFIFWIIVITFFAYFWQWFIFKNWISRLILIWWIIFSFICLLIVDFFINLLNSYIEEKKPYKIWIRETNFFNEISKQFKNYWIYELKQFDSITDVKKFDIIFLVWQLDSNLIEKIMDEARLRQIEVYHIPDVNFIENVLYNSERIWPVISWKYKPSPLEEWWKVFKRLFDIFFSLFFILLFWWLYVLIALRIYFHDKWNVIYVSKRVWQWWKIIKIYKFRTMIKNADKLKNNLINNNERDDILFKIKDDPRIMPWWKILRKTSLDEIPQFFNVLKWDMSIAWPRPHLKEEVKKYKEWQKRLLAAKPGITWFAQIFWRDLPFEEEAKLDLYRFQNRSIRMDIIVILWVFRTLFKWK